MLRGSPRTGINTLSLSGSSFRLCSQVFCRGCSKFLRQPGNGCAASGECPREISNWPFLGHGRSCQSCSFLCRNPNCPVTCFLCFLPWLCWRPENGTDFGVQT